MFHYAHRPIPFFKKMRMMRKILTSSQRLYPIKSIVRQLEFPHKILLCSHKFQIEFIKLNSEILSTLHNPERWINPLHEFFNLNKLRKLSSFIELKFIIVRINEFAYGQRHWRKPKRLNPKMQS